MKPVDAIPPRYRTRKKQIKPEIKPIKVCPMCGRLFLQNHGLRIYCRECAAERDKENKRKWVREHPTNVGRNYSNYRARHRNLEPMPTKGYAWDLVFGYIDGESFEHGVYDAVIYEEDMAFASWYVERRNYE